jgi:G:T-mismatch repair DNA endonuclease (very short patch repair protein)
MRSLFRRWSSNFTRSIRNIRHILDEKGEYKIENIGKVDGYEEERKTVYEYHGDYWHGNFNVFEIDDLNERSKKKFLELLIETIERDCTIVSLGYNFCVKWESSFPQYKTILEEALENYNVKITDENDHLTITHI